MGTGTSRRGLLALAALLLTGCLELPEKEPKNVTAVVIVLDASVAVERRCQELAARLDEVLARPEVKRLDVAVLATGAGSSGYEPTTLAPWRRWAPKPDLYEGKGKLAAAREAWTLEIRALCEANIKPVDVSAIVTATQRAVESLRARCAVIEQGGGRCAPRLAVHSDLRENVERYTRRALAELSRPPEERRVRPRVDGELSLPRIDAGGIELRVCGIADTTLGKNDKLVQPGVVIDVWRTILDAQAEDFDPICPMGIQPSERRP